MRRAILLAVLLPLAACNNEPDPARAGYFSGIGNLTSGTYERRVEEKRQELSQAEQLKQQFAAREQAARSERQQSTWELIQWRQRVDGLDGEIRRLEAQLVQARAQLGGRDARVLEAQRKLEAAKRARQSIAPQNAPDDAAQRRIAEQERAVADALKLVSRPE